MMQLIFATNNAHKVDEVRAAVGGDLPILTLRDAGIDIDIPEPFDNLADNAREKCRVIQAITKSNCFSEDSGLEVDALEGAPGVRSARYAGEPPDPAANIDLLLFRLQGIEDRSARFRTVICLFLEEKEYLFEGVCPGRIIDRQIGDHGFGYDPVFVPNGSNLTFAQMTMSEKNKYSHRKKAADQLVLFLQQRLSINPLPGK